MTTQMQLIEGAAPPRPKERCEEVIDAVAKALLPDVLEWLGEDAGDDTPEYICGQIREAIESAWDWDGYKITKALDGWDCDEGMVDIMGRAWGYAREAHDALVSKWIADYGIQPQFKIGDAVTSISGGKTITGDVQGIDAKRATYTVGHVKNCGFIVRFEDTKAATPATA